MFSINQQAIINLFITNPEQEYHLHEIGRILEKKPGVFQKALNALEREGILKSRVRGNQRLVSLNKQYPLLKEITKIMQKTFGIETMLRELVGSVDGIQRAYIFGSYVKDKMRSDSDIDVMIVGLKEAEDDILEGIEKIEKKIQREINPKFYTVMEYSKKIKQNDPFLEEVLGDDHIVLKGSL